MSAQLLKAVLLAALATLLYAGVVYGIVAANRRLMPGCPLRRGERIKTLRMAGVVVVHPRQFLNLTRRLVLFIAWAFALFATYLWLTYTLRLFPYTRPWGEQLRGYLVGLLGSMLHGIVHAIPGLLTVLVIFVITRFIVHLLDGFFQRVEVQHVRMGWLDDDTARPTRRIVQSCVWLFALVMAYPYLPGARRDAFKGLSVLVGSDDVDRRVESGSAGGQRHDPDVLARARAGEYVKIGDSEGTVVRASGLFATRLAYRQGRGGDPAQRVRGRQHHPELLAHRPRQRASCCRPP